MREPGSPSIELTDKDRAWLKRMRKKKKLFCNDVGAAIGYCGEYYNRVERGCAKHVRMRFVDAINELYGGGFKPEKPTPLKRRPFMRSTVEVTREYCNWLFNSRLNHGLTQREVGEKIGYSETYYSSVERYGVGYVSEEFADKISAIFGEYGGR